MRKIAQYITNDFLKSKIKLFVDWFIASNILNSSYDSIRRARLIVAYLLISIIMSIFYVVVYIWADSYISAIALEGAIVVELFLLFLMRKYGSIAFISRTFNATLFVLFTVLVTRLGGFDATLFAWYSSLPLIALSVSNRRSAFFWFIVSVLTTIIFYMFYLYGYIFPNDVSNRDFKILIFIGWIGIYAIIFFFTLQFEITKDIMMQKLQDSESRLLDITNSIGEWIWEIDSEWQYVGSMGKLELLLGYSNKEVIGKSSFYFMEKEEKKRIKKIFNKTATNKKNIVDIEHWSLSKTGERVCILTNGVPIFDKNNKLKGYRGVSKNITKRKELNNKLKRQKKDLLNSNIELDNSRKVALSIMQDTEAQKNKAEKALKDLETFNEAMVNREMRMIELKEEVNELSEKLGKKPIYPAIWKDTEGDYDG